MDTQDRQQPEIIHRSSPLPGGEAAACPQPQPQPDCATKDNRLAFGKVSVILMAVFTVLSHPYRAIMQLFDKKEKQAAPVTVQEAHPTPPETAQPPDSHNEITELPVIAVISEEAVATYSASNPSEREAMLSAARKALLSMDITKTSAH